MKTAFRGSKLTALSLSALLWACGGGDADATNEADTPAPAPAAQETPAQEGVNLAGVTLPEGVTAEMVNRGATLYPVQPCTACHLPNLQGGPLAPNLTDGEWLNTDGGFEGIVTVITEGVAEPRQFPGPMLARGGTSLTDDQIRDIAAYIWAMSHGAS